MMSSLINNFCLWCFLKAAKSTIEVKCFYFVNKNPWKLFQVWLEAVFSHIICVSRLLNVPDWVPWPLDCLWQPNCKGSCRRQGTVQISERRRTGHVGSHCYVGTPNWTAWYGTFIPQDISCAMNVLWIVSNSSEAVLSWRYCLKCCLLLRASVETWRKKVHRRKSQEQDLTSYHPVVKLGSLLLQIFF